jgi:hypothetical protein
VYFENDAMLRCVSGRFAISDDWRYIVAFAVKIETHDIARFYDMGFWG